MLALHGFLHVLGYDHETDDGTMDRLERRLRVRLAGAGMIGLQLVLILLLAGLSVFLATVEASFNLMKRRRLTQVGFHDEARVELAQRYLDDPPRMLMPVHLGTYTAHVGMTVIITSLAFRLVDHWAMLIAFGIMMAYLLLFRVSIPYILVRQDPEATFLRLLPAFHLWTQALVSPRRAACGGARSRFPRRRRKAGRARGPAAARAAGRRGAAGGRSRPLLGDGRPRGHDPAAGHRGDRRGGAGLGAAAAHERDQVQPDPDLRQGPRRHPGRRGGARPARLPGRPGVAGERPRASRPPRPGDEADPRPAAGDAGAADHLRGGDRRVRRHRRDRDRRGHRRGAGRGDQGRVRRRGRPARGGAGRRPWWRTAARASSGSRRPSRRSCRSTRRSTRWAGS